MCVSTWIDTRNVSVKADVIAKYMDGEIQSLSMVKIWGKEAGNITVSTYTTEEAWKQYQKMLEE